MATQSRVLSVNCLNQVVLYEVSAILRDHCTIKHASASTSDLRTKSLYYHLVILVLNKVHWKVDWNMVFSEVHRSDDVTISLPRLFNFCFLFDEEDREQSNMIAKSIEIPEDATWLYSSTAYYWGSVHEDDFFLRFAKSPDCENLEIEIKPRRILIRSSRPIANGDLRTEQTTYSSEILLNWKSSGSLDSIIERVVDLLELCKWKTAKSVKLNLYLTSWYLEGEEWIPFLSALPSVQDLEVMFEEKNTHFMLQNRKKSAEGFLKVLIHVDSLFIPPHPVLCRNLEHLNIKFGDRTLAPENLSSILREGLSNRKEMGLKLKSLSVSSHYVVEEMHKDFSDLVDKFSYN